MTNETDIKELKEEVKEMKDFPVKLSWKQIGILGTTIVTIIGSAFGVGIKVEYETQKIVQLKQEREFQKQLLTKEDEIIETKRKLKEISEENIYLSNQYEKVKERYEKCLKFSIIENIKEQSK